MKQSLAKRPADCISPKMSSDRETGNLFGLMNTRIHTHTHTDTHPLLLDNTTHSKGNNSNSPKGNKEATNYQSVKQMFGL